MYGNYPVGRPLSEIVEPMSTHSTEETELRDAGVVLHPTSAVFGNDSERPSRFNARKAALFVADLNAVALSLLVANLLQPVINPEDPVSTITYFWLFVGTFWVWPLSFTRQFLYRSRHIARSADEALRVVKAIFYGFMGVFAISIFVQVVFSRTLALAAFLIMLVIVGIERGIARYLFKRARTNGANLRNVLIVGKNQEGAFVREMLDGDLSHGYKVLGYLEDQLPGGIQDVADPEKALGAIKEKQAGGVIIAATGIDVGTSNQLIRTLTENDVHVELSSTLCDIALSLIHI